MGTPGRNCETEADACPKPGKRHIPLEDLTFTRLRRDFSENSADSKTTAPSTNETGEPIKFDPNLFARVKNIAQGVRDIAILAANAAQLKFLIEAGSSHTFYAPMMTAVIISIILEVSNIILIVVGSLYNINKSQHQKIANILNNISMVVTCVIVALNLFISIFGKEFYGSQFPESREDCDCTTSGTNDDVIFNANTKPPIG